MKELSIFVDESGNFGTYDYHSPYYIFSLICHNQNDDISNWISMLNRELDMINYGSRYFQREYGILCKPETRFNVLIL